MKATCCDGRHGAAQIVNRYEIECIGVSNNVLSLVGIGSGKSPLQGPVKRLAFREKQAATKGPSAAHVCRPSLVVNPLREAHLLVLSIKEIPAPLVERGVVVRRRIPARRRLM